MIFHPTENSSDTAKLYVPRLIKMYQPKSVLDMGCNVGWWLHYFMQHGITDVLGIDGDNMRKQLQIPVKKFVVKNLCSELNLLRKFDLVLCLEVAEHLSPLFAGRLVDNICNHTDTVFFSAATPGQGGYNHVNEQPHSYWIEKFEKQGFAATPLADILPSAPHDYYRKNAFEFKRIA